MKIKTIKISDGHGGFIRINEARFDEKKHELFEAKKEIAPNPDIDLITKEQAELMNRDELRDYAKNFGLNGTSKDGLMANLSDAGKIIEPAE